MADRLRACAEELPQAGVSNVGPDTHQVDLRRVYTCKTSIHLFPKLRARLEDVPLVVDRPAPWAVIRG